MNYKLSILIPTYNRLELFKETLTSILKQVDNEPVEIVIVDDGSTERNYEYALEISKKYPFVKVQRHEKNLGVGQARNTLLSLAKGEYLVFIASDDLLMDGALKKMLNLIASNGAECYVLNSYREKWKKLKFKPFPVDKKGLSLLKAYIDGAFSEALYLIKTEVARKYPVNPDLRVREDFSPKACYLVLANSKVINEPFVIIRDHPQRLRKVADYYFEHALTSVEDLFNRLPEPYQNLKPYALARTYLELAKIAYKSGLYDKARVYLHKSIESYPEFRRSFQYFKLQTKIYFKKVFCHSK
jgi:glycosyltransferase involved in cell wall biosynthesis